MTAKSGRSCGSYSNTFLFYSALDWVKAEPKTMGKGWTDKVLAKEKEKEENGKPTDTAVQKQKRNTGRPQLRDVSQSTPCEPPRSTGEITLSRGRQHVPWTSGEMQAEQRPLESWESAFQDHLCLFHHSSPISLAASASVETHQHPWFSRDSTHEHHDVKMCLDLPRNLPSQEPLSSKHTPSSTGTNWSLMLGLFASWLPALILKYCSPLPAWCWVFLCNFSAQF